MSAQDSIVTNFDKIAYTSYFDADKITAIYTGTVNPLASSAFSTTYMKSKVGVATSKSFTQMRYSIDGGVTWQDGDSRLNTYSGGSLQYYLVVTCSSSSSEVYIHVSNAGLSSGAPARTIDYEIVVFSTT